MGKKKKKADAKTNGNGIVPFADRTVCMYSMLYIVNVWKRLGLTHDEVHFLLDLKDVHFFASPRRYNDVTYCFHSGMFEKHPPHLDV